MKLIIQNSDSSLYLKDDQSWTPDPDEARNFPYPYDAVDFCKAQHLDHVQVVGKYEFTGDEVVMQRL